MLYSFRFSWIPSWKVQVQKVDRDRVELNNSKKKKGGVGSEESSEVISLSKDKERNKALC